MIKNYLLTTDQFVEVKPWLEQNLSEENVRWWVDTIFSNSTRYPYQIQRVTVEVTEEEKPLLTWIELML